MATLWDVQLESDLSEFDGNENGGDLAWAAAAALASSSGGLSVLIDDNNVAYYYVNFTNPTSGIIRFRVYFDPNALSMDDGDDFRICELSDSGTSGQVRVQVNMNGTTMEMNTTVRDDTGTNQTISSGDALTDAEHYIEVLIEKSATTTSDDAVVTVWLDGGQVGTRSDIDFFDKFADLAMAWIGRNSINSTTRGTIYLDEFFGNDTGDEIGPVSSGLSIIANYYGRKRVA